MELPLYRPKLVEVYYQIFDIGIFCSCALVETPNGEISCFVLISRILISEIYVWEISMIFLSQKSLLNIFNLQLATLVIKR